MARLPELVADEVRKKEPDIREMILARWRLGLRPNTTATSLGSKTSDTASTSSGDAIGTYRSAEYAEYKHEKNPYAGYGFVDLIDTGALGLGIKISPYGEDFEIYSTDPKYMKIGGKYGFDNFGISGAEKKILLDSVGVIVLQYIMSNTYQ